MPEALSNCFSSCCLNSDEGCPYERRLELPKLGILLLPLQLLLLLFQFPLQVQLLLHRRLCPTPPHVTIGLLDLRYWLLSPHLASEVATTTSPLLTNSAASGHPDPPAGPEYVHSPPKPTSNETPSALVQTSRLVGCDVLNFTQ